MGSENKNQFTTIKLTVQQSTASMAARRVTFEGREHLVVPVVAIREGVLNGELAPAEEIGRYVDAWNGIPLPIDHPMDRGVPISANRPDLIESRSVGRFWNASFEGNALRGELWVDIQKAQQLGGDALTALQRLENGEALEVSTAYFNDLEPTAGTFNGRTYNGIQRNLRPDHLALLPNAIGACSWADGCGAPRVNQEANQDQSSLDDVKKIIKALSPSERRELGPRFFYDDAQYRYIYRKNNVPAGFIENRSTGKKGHLNLAVHPSYRGEKIANKLIKKALKQIPEQIPATEKIYWITTPGNEASNKLAQKHGFIKKSENNEEVRYVLEISNQNPSGNKERGGKKGMSIELKEWPKKAMHFVQNMLGINAEDLSHNDLERRIRAALKERTEWVFIHDVFDDAVVYDDQPPDKPIRLLRRGYTIDNNNVVTLSDEYEEVVKVTKYEPVNPTTNVHEDKNKIQTTTANSSGNQEGEKKVNKTELINGLIANSATKFTENDRQWLEGMSECQLKKLQPVEQPAQNSEKKDDVPVTTTSNHEKDGPQANAAQEQKPKTMEQWINEIPDQETRDFIVNSRKKQQEHREKLIADLAANEQCAFDKDELGSMKTNQLEKLAQSLKVADYSGVGGPRINKEQDDEEIPAAPSVILASNDKKDKEVS